MVINNYGIGHLMWLGDSASRQRTWAHLQEVTARQEQLREEHDERIREAGPAVGDMVALGPLLRGVVVSISGSPPKATVAWDEPTGRGGGTIRMQDTRWLRDLQAVARPAAPPALPLPEEPLQLLPEALQDADAELA